MNSLKDDLVNHSVLKTIREFHVQPKKHFGQNFLLDNNYLDKIAYLASCMQKSKKSVCEIGSGIGNLTARLLDQGFLNVYALEKDIDLLPILYKMQQKNKNLRVLHADVRCFNFKENIKEEPFVLCGNVPYNITNDIMYQCLELSSFLSGALFLVQKEVAERIVSEVNSKQYGVLSVFLQSKFETEIMFNISKDLFFPKPKVESSLISLRPKKRNKKLEEIWPVFKRVVRAAFNQRRKVIKNSLHMCSPNIDEILHSLNLDPKSRAENLSVDNFMNIACALFIQENS